MRADHGGGSRAVAEVMVTAAVAGVVGGAPSTLHALVTGRPLLDAVRAAGTLLGRRSVPRGVVAHAALTVGWTIVLRAVLPPGRRAVWGAVAGLAIAALDLGLARRHWTSIAALSQWPQVADHVAFGAVAGAALDAATRR